MGERVTHRERGREGVTGRDGKREKRTRCDRDRKRKRIKRKKK